MCIRDRFNCGHFLSDKRTGDNFIKDEWVKLNGPFLLYFNEGNDIASIWKDAKRQAEKEKKQWPYAWMQHNEYPLKRGTVKGHLLIDGKPADASKIILAQPGIDWQAQSRSYMYNANTKADGSFQIENIRPGSYSMYAFGNNSTEEYQQNNITVPAGMITDLNKVNWSTSKGGDLLWQIGVADRKTTGFKLADSKRDYSVFKIPPAELNFTIGKNKESDWYYAQTKQGSWNINFTLSKELSLIHI